MNITQILRLQLLAFLLPVLLFASCSKKIRFVTSTVVPSAEGSVRVYKDDNNNHAIDINIVRLASPERLTPSRKVYVVWMETRHDGTRNIGQLKSDDSFFSGEQKASLQTVIPYEPKRLFITAEDDAGSQNPGSQIILTTKTF